MTTNRNMVIAVVVAAIVLVGVIVAVAFAMTPKVTLSMEMDGEGDVSPSVGNHTYDKDSTVTITVTPADGYALQSITADGERLTVKDNRADVKLTGNTKVTVSFVRYASISNDDPSTTMSVPGPYGNDTVVDVTMTGLVASDKLTIGNVAVGNYGPKASVFDFGLIDGSNFESASITMAIPGDVSKGTVVFLGDGSQPTDIGITYDAAGDVSTVRFVTTHFSDFLVYDGHVSTATGLRNIAQMVNTGIADVSYVILDNDIDLEGVEWVPIGKDSSDPVNKPYAFNGTFDGKGYRIMNMTITTGNDQVGLFGAIENGTVKDLSLTNVRIVGGSKVGAVAGETFFKTQIVDVDVKGFEITGNHFVGGIVGYMQGTVYECDVIGTANTHSTIKAIPNMVGTAYDNGDKVGGIVGYVQNHQTNLAYSVVGCEVEYVDITAYRDVGGVVGCVVETDPEYAVGIRGNILNDVNVYCDQSTNPYGFADPNVGRVIGRTSGEYDASNNLMSGVVTSVKASVGTANDLEEMMANASDSVYILLETDLSVDVDPRMGGRNTADMTIDGNGRKLTFVTDAGSAVDMVNPGAKLIVKNIEMTSSQTAGDWNVYDVTFLCNVELDSVGFDKPIALNNAGRTSVLKDVTIHESGDRYALWVVAGANVDIDGLAVNATKGINISDDGVTHPGMTELRIVNAKFVTQKEAAIMVGSAGGAYITWGSGNDISDVTADPNNEVWVNIDYVQYAGKVTVKGCDKIVEPSS